MGQGTRTTYVEVDGIRVRYFERGRGNRAVLLLHGLGGSLESWGQTAGHLAAHCRVVAVDLPGFGQSDKPHLPYSLAYFARFVDHFMGQVRLEGAVVIGHSMGAAVALELAASFPRRVSGLALLDQGLFSRLFLGGLRLASVPGVGRLTLSGGKRLLPLALRWLVSDRSLISQEWVDDQLAQNEMRGARSALLATIRSLPLSNREMERMIRTQLSRITVPILVIWGAEDRLIDVDASRRLFASWGNARIRVIAECGHSPQVERPREVNALLAEFIEAA